MSGRVKEEDCLHVVQWLGWISLAPELMGDFDLPSLDTFGHDEIRWHSSV